MFETAEIGQAVDRAEYKKQSTELRDRLLELQYRLRESADFAVLIDFAGVDGAGKGSTVNHLHSWLDARALVTNAYGVLTEDERDRPRFWRYWRDLPARGEIGFNLSGRYSRPFIEHVNGTIDTSSLLAALDRVVAFERALADDGALVLKFWMHLSRSAQKARLEALQNDPLQSWRVAEKDWDHYEKYDRFVATAEEVIEHTQSEYAPWHIVEGADSNYRILTVTKIIADALETRLGPGNSGNSNNKKNGKKTSDLDRIPERPKGLITILSQLDMTPGLEQEEYSAELAAQQQRLHLLQREALEKRVSTTVVFEGPDASGKGGAIRRIIPSLDARNYRVLQYGAPTDEENHHHYLWRFWRYIGRAGRLTVFDRSWYGRVLVERILGLATNKEWKRAYAEINDFEEQLINHHTEVIKFWLHITPEEQLARFEKRGTRQHKRWKLTDEDWRNRKDWYEYEQAAHDMVQHTSTRRAPWVLVPANDKRYARVTVLKTICDRIESKLRSLDG